MFLSVYIEETSVDINSFVQITINGAFRQFKGSVVRAGEKGWTEISIKFPNLTGATAFRVALRNYANSSATVTYRKQQLEKGNTRTDHEKAPEDTNQAIEDVDTRVTTTVESITALGWSSKA